MRTSASLAVLCFSLAACASLSAVGVRGGIPAEELAALAPPEADSYALFAHKCSRCHSLARPLTADITEPTHWRRYVTRMRRQPGSGISPADAETILVFLEHWAKKRAAEEATTKTASTAGATTSSVAAAGGAR